MVLECARGRCVCAVDEVDRPCVLAFQRGQAVHHGREWGEADAGGDQDERVRRGRGVEVEVAVRVRQLDGVADLHGVVQDVGHVAWMRGGIGIRRVEAWVLAHADAVVCWLGLVAERVLAALGVVELGHGDLDRDVLAREERGQGLAVDGLQVERGDHVRLGLLAGDAELAEVGPAVGGLVQVGLLADHEVGQLPVRRGPGVKQRRREGIAEDLAHGLEQELADDLVALGLDAERGMLVADALDGRGEHAQVVNIRSVGEESAGEGPRLVPVGLVGGIEDGLQLGVGIQHVIVEDSSDGLPVLLEDRHGGLDERDLFRRERHG